jgi:secreted trypsin-like serine protease
MVQGRTNQNHKGQNQKEIQALKSWSEGSLSFKSSSRTSSWALSLVLPLALGLAALTSACAPKSANDMISPNFEFADGIIGGQAAAMSNDFSKNIVALYNVAQGSLCTASIYSDTVLVTAAHCVEGADPTTMVAIFGLDLRVRSAVEIRRVVNFAATPVWKARRSQEKNTGDLAIVGFTGGLPKGYVPAEFLADASLLTVNQVVTLAGYGASKVVPTAKQKHQESGTLRFVETSIKDMSFSASEVVVEQSKGQGACHGDSGGPAYLRVNGKFLSFGVTSRGVNDRNDTCSVSAAYTSIPFYMKWIQREAQVLSAEVATVVPPVVASAGGSAQPAAAVSGSRVAQLHTTSFGLSFDF